METSTQALQKQFASVLRKRATGKSTSGINPKLLEHLSRKDLLTIIKKKQGEDANTTINLVEVENVDLLHMIGDEMHVIAFFTDKWSKETPKTSSKSTSTTSSKKPNGSA